MDSTPPQPLLPIIEFAPQGDYVSLRSRSSVSRGVSHKRGVVLNFSFRSRSRLQKKISQLSRHVLPLFLTLTYPSEFPSSSEIYKKHLHHFFTRLFQYYGRRNIGAIWKLEFQSRGAAHYHMLLWGVPVEHMPIIAYLWYRIVGSGDLRHLDFHLGKLGNGNQPCLQVIRSWAGVKSYASKYLGKVDDTISDTGRFWGVRGEFVPMSRILSFSVSMSTALQFRRAFARHSGMRFFRFGFWANGYHTDWLRLVDFLQDAEYLDDLVPEHPPMRYALADAMRHGF